MTRASGKHGPTLQTWRNMRDRCNNPKNNNFHNYGGRGITVCKRWNDSFEAFLEDMGRKPDGLSIDRQDNNGNYEPGNCRWATQKQQMRNTRANVVYEYQGVELCISELAERVGLAPQVIAKRLDSGWSLERATSTPLGELVRPEPFTRIQVAVRQLQKHRAKLEASGLTADQIANRAFAPTPQHAEMRGVS